MDLKGYRTVFTVISLASTLVVATPLLSMFVSLNGKTEKFSELWILGPNHMVGDYPFNVHANEPYRVFVGCRNHMGSSSQYVIYVKFSNQTQPSPDSVSSSRSPLFEFQFFVVDGGSWEVLVSFSLSDVSHSDNSLLVGSLSINDLTFPVTSIVNWDSEHKGFFYQLFFELWRYDVTTESFRFHDRFVGIWLNVTG